MLVPRSIIRAEWFCESIKFIMPDPTARKKEAGASQNPQLTNLMQHTCNNLCMHSIIYTHTIYRMLNEHSSDTCMGSWHWCSIVLRGNNGIPRVWSYPRTWWGSDSSPSCMTRDTVTSRSDGSSAIKATSKLHVHHNQLSFCIGDVEELWRVIRWCLHLTAVLQVPFRVSSDYSEQWMPRAH